MNAAAAMERAFADRDSDARPGKIIMAPHPATIHS